MKIAEILSKSRLSKKSGSQIVRLRKFEWKVNMVPYKKKPVPVHTWQALRENEHFANEQNDWLQKPPFFQSVHIALAWNMALPYYGDWYFPHPLLRNPRVTRPSGHSLWLIRGVTRPTEIHFFVRTPEQSRSLFLLSHLFLHTAMQVLGYKWSKKKEKSKKEEEEERK